MGVIAAALSLLPLGFADSAGAAPAGTATDFAADCDDDGLVVVTGRTVYRGGSATFSGMQIGQTWVCFVRVEPGATLVLRRVDLTGTQLILGTGPHGDGATVQVHNSTIELDGYLELTPGANAGDPEVFDNDVTLLIRRSRLDAAGIMLATSFDWPNGRTEVRNSELHATGNVWIEASLGGGSNGSVAVLNSTVDAGGDVLIRSGTAGRTLVRRSAVTGSSVTVQTGAGGTCDTVANVPPLGCS